MGKAQSPCGSSVACPGTLSLSGALGSFTKPRVGLWGGDQTPWLLHLAAEPCFPGSASVGVWALRAQLPPFPVGGPIPGVKRLGS